MNNPESESPVDARSSLPNDALLHHGCRVHLKNFGSIKENVHYIHFTSDTLDSPWHRKKLNLEFFTSHFQNKISPFTEGQVKPV